MAKGIVSALHRQKKMPVTWIASQATTIAADSDTPTRVWCLRASD
ncbi:hypothetical protein [Sphingomonas sp. PP-F2F-A104-K0414]|nr:hypothetical protein [Sphingomonas sp. PP-F2F-A104-K0414]